ncbi:MAG: AMP-binding protein [Microthrixaceae bacterium]|nr:AMP-binding protein [Microthrixaceae bacterium]
MPVNINYRYMTDELAYLFADGPLTAVVCPPEYLERVAEVAPGIDSLRLVLVTGAGPDEPTGPFGNAEVYGYESALASSSEERPVVSGRGDDDLYVIYTGGTTGLPKGVVWAHGGRVLRMPLRW